MHVSPISLPAPSASSPVLPVPSSEVPPDALLPAEGVTVPEQILDVQVHPSGSSTASIVISGREDAIESTPLPPAKRELVLGLPAAGAAPLPKGRARAGAASGAKRKRGAKSEEGELSEPLARHRSKVRFRSICNSCIAFFYDDTYPFFCGQFVSLIDGMLGECGSEVIRLSKELELSQEALKHTEAALQTVEETHAAQTS